MWPFKRKARNRRNERETVLDVRMRSRTARAARFRAITAAVAIVGSTALGALLAWQGYQWALKRFVYSNEAFTIRRIELRHDGRLRPEQILCWARVQTRQNLLAIDLGRVRHELELNPWIARAEAENHRPDTLRLSVYEREPVAQIVFWRFSAADHRTWAETNYVDQAGHVMPPLTPSSLRPGSSADFSHLTRLVGLEPGDVNPGQRLDHPGVRAALALIHAYEESAMYSAVDLDELDVTAPDVLTGRLRQGTRVVFGVDGFERQMRLWQRIHQYGSSISRIPATMDLSVTNNLPVRWQDPATNSPVPVRTSKPQRPAKSHV